MDSEKMYESELKFCDNGAWYNIAMHDTTLDRTTSI